MFPMEKYHVYDTKFPNMYIYYGWYQGHNHKSRKKLKATIDTSLTVIIILLSLCVMGKSAV